MRSPGRPANRDSTTRGPRRAVTGRALVLGTVVVLLLVLLASPLSRYFASRSALSDSASQLSRDKARLGELRQEIARWGEPGYIQAQARKRLQYAMPGDTVYVTVNRGERNDIARTSGTHRASSGGGWNTALWDSVQRADDAQN
jgi:cell division protein FtsB